MTLLTLRLWPVVYQQDTAIAASDAAAVQVTLLQGRVRFAKSMTVPAQAGSSTHTVPVRFYTPTRAPRIGRRDAAGAVSDNASNVVVLLLHGGGWVTGGGQSHDGLASAVAYATGHVVAAPDYSCQAHDMCVRTTHHQRQHSSVAHAHLCDALALCRSQHAPVAEDEPPAALSIVLGGDGVGGNLAAALTLRPPLPPLRSRSHNDNSVCAAVLAYPLLDPTLSAGSHHEDGGSGLPMVLKAEHVAHYWDMYLPPLWRERHQGLDGSDYLIAPLLAPLPLLARQPPTLVLSATVDIARDDGESYIEQLQKAAAAAASANGGAPAAAQSHAVRLPRTVRGFFGRRSHEGGAASLKEMKAHIQRHCA
ncbi:Alpha/Beta hydrolase protein [Tribonema minus]|uniref:Alpha/Beta hydrolase protein n=1 Tax=Tribonema minus TaxID=303371 RepID=A0A835Z071_9STRA|nr:Alpha/Beta hydrolase protein [Tribonema minus]